MVPKPRPAGYVARRQIKRARVRRWERPFRATFRAGGNPLPIDGSDATQRDGSVGTRSWGSGPRHGIRKGRMPSEHRPVHTSEAQRQRGGQGQLRCDRHNPLPFRSAETGRSLLLATAPLALRQFLFQMAATLAGVLGYRLGTLNALGANDLRPLYMKTKEDQRRHQQAQHQTDADQDAEHRWDRELSHGRVERCKGT